MSLCYGLFLRQLVTAARGPTLQESHQNLLHLGWFGHLPGQRAMCGALWLVQVIAKDSAVTSAPTGTRNSAEKQCMSQAQPLTLHATVGLSVPARSPARLRQHRLVV